MSRGGRLVVGDRVRLVSVDDPHTKLKEGDEGTVTGIDALETVHVRWDNGSRLGLIVGVDVWEILT